MTMRPLRRPFVIDLHPSAGIAQRERPGSHREDASANLAPRSTSAPPSPAPCRLPDEAAAREYLTAIAAVLIASAIAVWLGLGGAL